MIQKPLRRHRVWIGRVPIATAVVAITPLIPSLNVVQSADAHTFRRGSVVIQRIPKETIAVIAAEPKPRNILVVTYSNPTYNGKAIWIKQATKDTGAAIVIPRPKPILVARQLRPIQGRNTKGIIWLPRVLKETIAVVYPACSWGDHFQSHGWTTIQEQIDAGFPLYIQPTPLTGSYEKIFDFGVILNSAIVILKWDQNQIAGSTIVTSEISHSLDGISYSAPVSTRSLFIASLRYVKIKFIFTGTDSTAILEFFNFVVDLNVKVETDSGSVNADKDDVGGTVVLFNKTFRDINSITLTVDSLEPITAIYDFTDVPNPTQFKVLVFDNAGNRIDYLVSWKARGIT